jgi:hypothetical protein
MKSVRLLTVVLAVAGLSITLGGAQTQGGDIELLLAGTEYRRADLRADPTGAWWVLHVSSGATLLESMEIRVTEFRTCGDELPDQHSGRAVSVPGTDNPILLVRGDADFTSGPVHSAFLDDGVDGEAERIETRWEGWPVIVSHLSEDPQGDQPGRYRVGLAINDQEFELHSDQWHGDGHWRLRWMGDLNRDGWPDLLVDASHKYSVYTSRLFLSSLSGGRLEFSEVATFTHSAC